MTLPTGTVTFLFTDIEGSTRLLQDLGERYKQVLETQASILRGAVTAAAGIVVSTEGDAFFCVFTEAPRAVDAVVEAQRSLSGRSWPRGGAVRVRMGLHTGQATLGGDDYVGLDVHRAARVASAGHGGQVLISDATRGLVENALPDGVILRDLGAHRLKDLTHPLRLHQVVIPGLPEDFPRLKTLDATANNLPVQLTSFVGRRRELEEGRSLLQKTRLLTLTGPGGTGKTRLALQLAAESTEEFPDGVFFVPLATIEDPQLLASAAVSSLGLPFVTGRPMARLVDFLRDKRLLLVLDNFEQILEGAPQAAEILRAAPEVRAIVTSRAALRVYGEQEYPVPPLRPPDLSEDTPIEELGHSEAVSLFTERAAAARPDFALTRDNARAVAEIASRLDGLPLALELAAARVKLLPPQAIVERLASRLSLLEGGPRDLPTRQQTLRDAIAWSYDLLDEVGRKLLDRMGVFAGGARLPEIESVCGSDLDSELLEGLGLLVDQSMLRQEEADGEPRFVMLETIREFALERLAEGGEEVEIRARHAEAYLRLAEEAEPHLLTRGQLGWLDRLEREVDNFRSSLSWLVDQDETDLAQRMAAALWRFWQVRGYLQEARERLEEVLARGGTEEIRAKALEAAGGVAYWQGDGTAASAFYRESLDLHCRRGDRSAEANALYNLSFSLLYGEEPEASMDIAEESLALYRRLGEDPGIAKALWGKGSHLQVLREYDQARELLTESLDMFRRLDDPFGIGWALYMLGSTEAESGNLDEARSHLRESLRMFAEVRDVSGVVLHLGTFAQIALEERDEQRAIRLLSAMNSLGRSSGAMLIFQAAQHEDGLRQAVERLMPIVEAAGNRPITLEEAVAYALEEAGR